MGAYSGDSEVLREALKTTAFDILVVHDLRTQGASYISRDEVIGWLDLDPQAISAQTSDRSRNDNWHIAVFENGRMCKRIWFTAPGEAELLQKLENAALVAITQGEIPCRPKPTL